MGKNDAAAPIAAPGGFPKFCSKRSNAKSLKRMAPRARFELAANRLTADCSTTELPRNTNRTRVLARLPPQTKHEIRAPRGAIRRSGQRKMRPGRIPAPRRWVMVGCLQGRRGNFSLWIVNKPLTVTGPRKKSSPPPESASRRSLETAISAWGSKRPCRCRVRRSTACRRPARPRSASPGLPSAR